MKTIRKSIFETNSSSVHALVIKRDEMLVMDYKNEEIELSTHKNEDYDERDYISLAEKVQYLFRYCLFCHSGRSILTTESKLKKQFANPEKIKETIKTWPELQIILDVLKAHNKTVKIDCTGGISIYCQPKEKKFYLDFDCLEDEYTACTLISDALQKTGIKEFNSFFVEKFLFSEGSYYTRFHDSDDRQMDALNELKEASDTLVVEEGE